jgi:thiol-disulfide isomerase/thioredoxin
MSDKKIEETKEEIRKEIVDVREDLADVREDLVDIREDIVDVKDDLIENKAEEIKAEKKKKGIMMYIFIAIFVIAVIIVGVVYYNKKNGSTMPKQEAIDKAFEYIKVNLAPGMDLKIGSIDEKTKTFYRFVVMAGEQEVPTYISTDGKTLVFSETDISKTAATAETQTPTTNSQIDGKDVVENANGFKEVQGAEICKENGKPIVYFFGSESCAHCQWEKPIIDAVAQSFGSKISYHKNIDTQTDIDLFSKFNPEGGIPTIIIGCKYFRIGSGEGSGEAAEKQTLTDVINSVLQ